MKDYIVTCPKGIWNVNLSKLAHRVDNALLKEEQLGWTTEDGAEVTVKVQDLLALMRIAGWETF